jgi:hypothetical protein
MTSSDMPTNSTPSLFTRLRARFARDGEAFWFDYFSDEERALREMDLWQLAGALEEAEVRGATRKRIVIEHLLNVRLARLQASASWGSALVGAIVGAALGALLTWALSR